MSTPLPIAQLIMSPALERTMSYAHKVLDDIPQELFTARPHPTMNHPAFYVGHLTLYPSRIAALCGRPDAIKAAPDAWQKLFAAGVACADDAGQYPAKDVLLSSFYEGYDAVHDMLHTVSDAELHRPNPVEGPMREYFPATGLALAFLTGHHLTLHLGQISAWRRAVGLPAAL